MRIDFPSDEFDSAVSAVCHGVVSDEQVRALNELLRNNAAARDEYILKLEIHARGRRRSPSLHPTPDRCCRALRQQLLARCAEMLTWVGL